MRGREGTDAARQRRLELHCARPKQEISTAEFTADNTMAGSRAVTMSVNDNVLSKI